MSERRRHVPELDGIRGLAIAAVIVFHYWLDGCSNDAWWFQAGSIGWAGVDLFFVLSGFLLGGQILDAGDGFSRARFWTRRAARILPLYLLLVASWLAVRHAGPAALHGSTGHMPAWVAFTLTQDLYEGFHFGWMMQWIGPTWSLAIEEHFYLLLPLVLPWAIRRRRVPQLCVSAIAFALLFRFAIGWWGGSTSMYFPTPSRVDGPAAGVLLAWLVRSTAVLEWRRWAPRAALGLGILAGFQAHFGRLMMSGNAGAYTVTAAASMALIAAALQGGWTAAALRTAPLGWLGTRAYGLYLWHFPTFLVAQLRLSEWPARLAAAAAAVMLAEISYRAIEQPIIRWAAQRTRLPPR